MMSRFLFGVFVTLCASLASGQEGAAPQPPQLHGRVVVGYQGWFTADGDGMGLGWRHWGRGGRFEPGHCSIDLWPALDEYPRGKTYPTPFRHADGGVARVFSSADPETVDLHVSWMRRYGIQGLMAQRFVTATRKPKLRALRDRVIDNVRASSARHEVPWALMYDLSGSQPRDLERTLPEDLRRLKARGVFRDRRHYLHVGARPLLAIWGIGFSDGRAYDLEACRKLLKRLDAEGWALFLGVPYWWQRQDRDAVAGPAWKEILDLAAVVSPWSVGRYRTPEQAGSLVRRQVKRDRSTLEKHGAVTCPVVFPGFSWHNLKRGGTRDAPLDQIPRRGGRFLEAQIDAAMDAGARMLYVAMFDELDEGTAIMKVATDPPVGVSPFLSFPEELGDRYLRIVGEAAKRLASLSSR